MRRDRQMFPPRQLLHAAARLHLIYQRNKERKKEGKKRRKEGRKKKAREERRKNPSFRHSFIQLESLGRERERDTEKKKDKPTPAQEGGPSPFKRTQPLCCVVKPLDRPWR